MEMWLLEPVSDIFLALPVLSAWAIAVGGLDWISCRFSVLAVVGIVALTSLGSFRGASFTFVDFSSSFGPHSEEHNAPIKNYFAISW